MKKEDAVWQYSSILLNGMTWPRFDLRSTVLLAANTQFHPLR